MQSSDERCTLYRKEQPRSGPYQQEYEGAVACLVSINARPETECISKEHESEGSIYFANRQRQRRKPCRTIPAISRLVSSLLLCCALQVCPITYYANAMADTPPGTVPCDDSSTCTLIVGPGSECIEPQGLCSNPFVSGCLRAMLGQGIHDPNDNNNNNTSPQTIADPKRTLRVCNSQDDPETIANNLCIPSPLDYMEIRILTGNWESSLLTAWALQIVLSEWMEIPTSIESSSPDRNANFYHPTNEFQYGAIAYDYKALEVANEVGDCRPKDNQQQQAAIEFVETVGELSNGPGLSDNGEYMACAHIMPEVWNGQSGNLWNLTKRRIIEAPEGNGVVGKLTWYIPRWVAEENPEWAHYSGWTKNRTTIATHFFRPLRWDEYCQDLALSNCAEPDEYATRPPSVAAEEGAYYMYSDGEGFRGYFHATDDNQCPNDVEMKDHECIGHFTDFACDWSSFAVPQAYHLGIAVESKGSKGPNGGYTYGDKLQIWQAANATQQYVVMNWYTPDPTYQWYRGTEAEFQEVQLPPPSPECVKERVTEEQRCSEDLADRVGSSEGACGAETQPLEKVVVRNLYHTIYSVSGEHNSKTVRGGNSGTLSDGTKDNMDREYADSTRSPAYEAVKNFHLSEFDVGKMFEDWRDRLRARGHEGFSTFEGTTGADPRHVVCQWVSANTEHLQTFVPFTYPRILQEDAPNNVAVSSVAMAFGIIVLILVVVVGLLTYRLRNTATIRTAQLPFLFMVLLGLLLISAGGIVFALAPGSVTCVLRNWLICMGYSLEMVPLIVKIGAISKMMQAAKKMRRVMIPREQLFGAVGGICLLVALYLTAWTVVDAPTRGRQLTLQLDDDYDDKYEESDPLRAWWQVPATTITVSHYCRSSGSSAWFTISVAWQCLLLMSAAIIAMQTRRIQRRWNESRSLAIMIYTQFFCLVVRFLVWLLKESSGVEPSLLDVLLSILFSLDALLALLIYFGSKLVNVYKQGDATFGSSVSGILASRIVGDNSSRPDPSGPSLENVTTVSQYLKAIGYSPESNRRLLLGPASLAGDIIVSKASSRRLNVRDHSYNACVCPHCMKCNGNTPSKNRLILSKDDFDLPTALERNDAISHITDATISEHSFQNKEAAALVQRDEEIDKGD